jgi:hypothetical protein
VIQHIDVHSVLQESSAGVYTDLVTRPTGRVVRERIQRVIAAGGGGPAVARMDFSGVGCMDYSCADEIVARLVREWPAVLLLRNLTDGHREAIQPVLAAHGLAVLVEQPDGTLDALGTPAAAVDLLEQLVTQRLARRLPGGTFVLLTT